MTAYAAVISLMHTILHLLRSPHIWVVPPSQKLIQTIYRQLQSLQEILLKLDSSRCRSRSMKSLDTLDAEIREVVFRFEDLLESHLFNQLLSQNDKINGDESYPPLVHIVLQDLERDVHSFTETLNSMKVNYVAELEDSLSKEEEEEEEEANFGGKESKLVGLSDQLRRIENNLRLRSETNQTSEVATYDIKFVSLVGMAGIGKTTVVKEIFENPSIKRDYKFRVWVTGGRKCQLKEILQLIVPQLVDLYVKKLMGVGPEYSMKILKAPSHDLSGTMGGLGERDEYLTTILLDTVRGLEEIDEYLKLLLNRNIGLKDMAEYLMNILKAPSHNLLDADYLMKILDTMGELGEMAEYLRKILKAPSHNLLDTMGGLWEMPGYLRKISDTIKGLGEIFEHLTKILKGEGLEQLFKHLIKKLKAPSFIVLDDLWDKQVVHALGKLSRGKEVVCRFLITTRLLEVAEVGRKYYKMPFLTKENSWDLLCNKVFGEDRCPPQLEKIGKKIAEKCEGLPLTIVTVASLLSKVEKTPEYWTKVAERKNHPIFITAYEKISKVLYPSYEYLTQHLKMCFLYLGVFPQSSEIHISKIINLWTAEGFFEENMFQSSEDYVEKSLNGLVSNSLLLNQNCIIWGKIKTCKVHSVVWYLCNKVAGKNKFFHVLRDCAHDLEECIKGQRRLCMHNNVLLGIKKVHNLREDNCEFTSRSFLCFGPYHQYPLPICFGLRLLRVLDAITIRFYEFPMKVLQLVLLRYLGLTCNGRLPSSISKLSNLEFLIVNRHLGIKFYRTQLHLPMEIWELKQLSHLQITGSDLQDPLGTFLDPHGNFLRPNFSTLLDVSSRSCTKSVFERIPNLKKLRIRIELAPDQADDGVPLCCFDNIYHLKELESLKCVIVNPTFKPGVVSPLVPLSIFSSSLKKFCLSGLGYPWEEMSKINAWLPNLEVLKLVHNAFRGQKWEIEEHGFLKLVYLLIEDTDLVQWNVGHGRFPNLKRLSLRHCYKLQEIHGEFNRFLDKIEVVDCNPSVVTCLKQTKKALSERISVPVNVDVHSSWLEKRK